MQNRTVKKNHDQLSTLGFGCMRFPQKNLKIDYDQTKVLLEKAIDLGVNYFDTAYIYHLGQSEKVIGQILKPYRDKIKIADKMPVWLCKKESDFEKYFNEQLKRLDTSYIDYYLIHSVFSYDQYLKLKEMGILSFLEKKVASKEIINIGFSYHGNQEDFKKIIDDYDWCFCQIQYNLYDENFQAGKVGLEYAASKEIAVFIMEPLRGGILANKIPSEVQHIYNEFETTNGAYNALAWILNHKEVTLLLSGMNNMDHLLINSEVCDKIKPNSISNQDLIKFQKIQKTYQTLIRVPCTACQYCMPCPHNVDIPGCFELYNDRKLGSYWMMQGKYIQRYAKDNALKASNCVGCKLCEKHCPQHIEIAQELKKVVKENEGIVFKLARPIAKRFL